MGERWYPGKIIEKIRGERFQELRPRTYGLWEAIAGCGGLEDALHREDVKSAIDNIRTIDRGIDIMFEDKLISAEERIILKEKLREIGHLVYEKKWDEILTTPGTFWELHKELENLLEKLCRV
jgi:hypothetical protein